MASIVQEWCAAKPGIVVCGALYDAVDIKGMFIDAVERGEPRDGKILRYRWDEISSPFYAIIQDMKTGTVAAYEMDMVTRKPRFAYTVSAAPILSLCKRPARMSWEEKVSRATMRWQKRY